MEAERTWQAMGTTAQVLVYADNADKLASFAQRRINALEKKWSRFLPYSEITQLNAANGNPTHVSEDTALLIRRAIEGYKVTHGLFDPTILGDLIRAGYTSSFETLSPNSSHEGDSDLFNGMEGIAIDSNNVVTMRRGVGFDPGGIGKGLAADIVAREVMDSGAHGVLINIGGDMRAMGTPSDASSWRVSIEDANEQVITTIAFEQGALATSTTKKRAWLHNDQTVHHLIDPKTGMNPTSDVTLTSVLTSECWQAEVLAKALVIGDKQFATSLVTELGAQYLMLDQHENQTSSPGWENFTIQGVHQ